MKVKIEINTREHFELLGTKLRALYQRRKGRDLYDLWLRLTRGEAEPAPIVTVFWRYMEAAGLSVSGAEFRSDLAAKLARKEFLSDTENLLRSEVEYDPRDAFAIADQRVLTLLDA